MGSYTRPKRIYRLRFSDPEMDGLVVRVRGLPLGKFLDLIRMANRISDDSDGDDRRRVVNFDPDLLNPLFEGFAECLVEWNLDEDGRPVPTTLPGILTQEPDFILAIIDAWMDAVGGVTAPLKKRSPDGDRSLEASMPMETLSESRAS